MTRGQRFTKDSPCPICHGYAELPRGHAQRCYGFLSTDGTFAHCTREEYAGRLKPDPNGDSWAHPLEGQCRCGERHDARPEAPRPSRTRDQRKRLEIAYDYTDEHGTLLFQAVRYRLSTGGKTFSQRRPDGQGGWIPDIKGVRRVPYRLPELLAAIQAGRQIVIPEGEKDVDRLMALGHAATCNPMGAKKWPRDFDRYFKGCTAVVVLADHDQDGDQHAAQVCANLRAVVPIMKRHDFTDLPKGGDVSDWLDAGHTAEDLAALLAAATPDTGHHDSPSGPPDPTPLSDQYNAEALVQAHGTDLRYCERWKSWLIFDGQRWVIDETGQVMRWAKDTVKALGARLAEVHGAAETKAFLAHLQRSLSRRSLEAMVHLAQSEPGIAVTPEAFDRDPMLFNVQNGTLDLRTATLRPHRRDDLLMKMSPVPYGEDATCPRWEQFLREIYAGDRDLIAFDQKSTGYTMTGETREQVVFICEGSGTNGKSTKLSLMRELMGEGEYALRTNLKAFTESTAHHQPASLEYYIAKLQHVRFAYASEGEEGARLSEALIKDVTGGVDFITGRHPYGQPFSFRPRFKLWLGTNHEPVIRGTDPAIWRRPRKIPFTVSFEGREDKDLFAALCQELPGILRWAVKGCLLWQMHGLEPPTAVKDATTAYRHSMDVVGRFIEESCTLNKALKIESTALYNAYQKWCDDTGETAVSQRKLAGQLKERGLRNDTLSPITNRVMWTGIGLRMAGDTTF